jgi:O-antigen ligase
MRIFLIILSLSFIIGLFINWNSLREKLKGIVSQFKAIHYAWIVLFVAILNFGKIESTSLLASNGVQIVLVLFSSAIVGFSLLTRFHYALASIRLPLFCLILYGFSGILSGAISPFPAFSVYKAFLILIGAMAGMLFLSYKPQNFYALIALDLSIFFYWVMILIILLGGIISPELAFIKYREGMIFGMLSGWIVVTNPNSVGLIAGVLALVCINRAMGSRPKKEKLFYFLASVVSVSILILAQSRTCIAGFAVSFVLLLLKHNFKYLLIFIFLSLLLFAVVGIDVIKQDSEQYLRRGQTDKQFETWSGRIPMWQYSWERFKDQPFLGYGMAAGVRFGGVSDSLGGHLHSSYFEVLLNSGLIGFIPWIICLFHLMGGVFKRYLFSPVWFTPLMKERHNEVTAILLFLFVRSIAGTTFVVFDHTFMLYIALIAYGSSITKESWCSATPAPGPGVMTTTGKQDFHVKDTSNI